MRSIHALDDAALRGELEMLQRQIGEARETIARERFRWFWIGAAFGLLPPLLLAAAVGNSGMGGG